MITHRAPAQPRRLRGSLAAVCLATWCLLAIAPAVCARTWIDAPCAKGFARFGWVPNDSFLVGGITADGQFPRGATWGYPNCAVSLLPGGAEKMEVRAVNWVTKTLRLKGAVNACDVTYSTCSPGILVDGTGDTLVFGRFGLVPVIGGDEGQAPLIHVAWQGRDGLRSVEVLKDASATIDPADLVSPWLVIWDDIACQPVEVVFTRRPAEISVVPSEQGAQLKARFASAGWTAGLSWCLGRTPLSRAQSLLEGEALSGFVADHCRTVARLLMAFPTSCAEEYSIERDTVRVRNSFEYRTLESDWDITPLQAAPIPPMVSIASRLGYPLHVVEDTTDLRIPTVWGPLEVVAESASAQYDLWLPPLEETGYVDVAGQDEIKRELNRCAGLEGYPEPGYNGWPEGTVSVNFPSKITGNALCAWALLTPEQQAKIADANHANMQAWASGDDSLKHWTWRTEPFTGLSYPACFGETSGVDISWGSGLAVNGLQKYAHIFGEWGMVDRNWDFVNGAMAYIELGHDWAMMGDSAKDDGSAGFGIDVATASYAGAVSAARMAKVLGKQDEFVRYAALAAKMAVPLTARMKFDDYAWEHELHCDRHFINGFQEGQLWQHNAAGGNPDPWWLTCALNGYGVHQELFDLLDITARPEMRQWAAMVPQYFPRILDGEKVFRYPYPTSHNGNSGYITLHWFHTRSLLGESEDLLMSEMAHNRDTAWGGFYWMAPIVYAGLMDRHSPIVLSEWAPAAYVLGSYAPDAARADLVFRLPEGKSATIEAGVRTRPSEVLVNGAPVAWSFDGAANAIARPRALGLRPNYIRVPVGPGESRITVQWPQGGD